MSVRKLSAADFNMKPILLRFAAGMQKEMSIVIVLLSFLIGMAMLGIGLSLGNYLDGKSRLDISWISGVVFLFLAFL